MIYDTIIIGAGPCGVTASLYTVRAGLKTLVIDSGESALLRAERICNLYGFDEISGKELYNKGLSQIEKIGAELIRASVTAISKTDTFLITAGGIGYASKTVLIATGSKREKPDIDGLQTFEGAGVSYCAVCDGFFFRGRQVAVIGSGEYARAEAGELKNICREVKVFTDGKEITADFSGLEVITEKISAVTGDKTVDGILLDNKTKVDVDGVFIAIGTAGAFSLAKKLGAATSGAGIIVNDKFETSVRGLYAAGDCVDGIKQIAFAQHSGMSAALEIKKYLRSDSDGNN